LLEAKLAAALAKVDVPITSSCMCRTKVYLPRNAAHNEGSFSAHREGLDKSQAMNVDRPFAWG
jgi:hypothetical protein